MNLPSNPKLPLTRRVLIMFSLIMAGETIYLPAFHLGRYFKSSLLATFSIDEFQLGQLGAIYGTLATACYFLGGPIADRWSPRKLISMSLVLTGLGGFYMATIPSFPAMCVLFGFWGVTTILAFWAPLIRATQELAGKDGQGRAFGILDGGRGLASAVIASLAAVAFTAMVGRDSIVDAALEAMAVQRLVISYACYCMVAAVCVWLFVPEPATSKSDASQELSTEIPMARRVVLVVQSPAIWLQAMVIIAAYSAFKMLDNYGIYSEDAYGLSRSESAKLIAQVSYVRVFAALTAGWVADRVLGVRATIQCCFGLLLIAYVCLYLVVPNRDLVWVLGANMVASCAGFFALRGIYFAMLDDSGIPRQLTGTAVGVISFVGFTPEIFMGPLTGWLIRNARAKGDVLVGYHQCFAFLTLLCICGILSAFALRWFVCKKPAAATGSPH